MKRNKAINTFVIISLIFIGIIIPNTLGLINEPEPTLSILIDAPIIISPVNNAFIGESSVTLDWYDVTGAIEYHLIFRTTSGGSSSGIYITESRVEFSDINDNSYEWYVSAKNSDNQWSANSITRQFTIDTIPPDTPTLLSPINGVFRDVNTPTFFDWDYVPSAFRYDIQIDNNDDFSSIISSVYLTSSQYNYVNSLSDGVYYWRVRAEDRAGNYGDWSEIFQFTVDTSFAGGTPVLISPHDGVTFNNNNGPFFECRVVPTATQYQYQIDNNDDFSSLEIDSVRSSRGLVCPYLSDDTYYWRVRAGTNPDNRGPWSEVRYFNIVAPLDSPTLISLANGTITNDVTPDLDWGDLHGAARYNIVLYQNNTEYASQVFSDYVTSSNLTCSSLSDGNYIWRVRARRSVGSYGRWSDYQHFQIDTKAPVITQVKHTPNNPTEANSIFISCDVFDQHVIDSVILHYRFNSGIWNDIAMILISGTTYQVNLGSFAGGTTIDYKISAIDSVIGSNEDVNDNGGSNFSFIIQSLSSSPPPTSTPSTTPTNQLAIALLIPFSVIMLISIIIIRKKK